MLTFNDILQAEGLDPRGVRLVKHQDKRAPLYEIWRTKPRLLERYQAIQGRDVFRIGDRLASFVVTPQPWAETLFIGMFLVRDVQRAAKGTTDPILGIDATGLFQYKIARTKELLDYVGRLTIDWGPGHLAWVQRTARPKRVLSISNQVEPPFPGFDTFTCDVDAIDDLYPSWKEVLRHAKGVYLLVDQETGARYVGSACGPDSLWGRFKDYAVTGHGGNKELKRLGRRPYRASVLQIGHVDEDILEAEAKWKDKLMTRQFGLNGN
jgi:GIY-YIG catalytic domain